jgi:rod shape determining protein RodA
MGLLLAVLGLLAIGLPAIYSASHLTDGAGKLVRQGIWLVAGLIGTGVLAAVDYRALSRHWRLFYFLLLFPLCILALLNVLHIPFGLVPTINGARSWFVLGKFSLQPSEFGKLLLILAYGALLARYGPLVRTIPVFLRGLLFVAVPMLLVLLQPDFGTMVIYASVWLVMTLIAGARPWMLLAVCLLAVGVFAAAWKCNIIKPYQKDRLDFIHADPRGNGYNQEQARIAIGAGEFFGKGYLHGSQIQHGFLPEQETDFIFAVVGEEFGFLGSIAVLGFFLLIFFRLFRLVEAAETRFGRIVTAGIVAMLMAHVLINVGMCLKLCPVTGVPLPFVSYGGSNLMTNLLALGVVLNISRHCENRRAWANPEEALVRM